MTPRNLAAGALLCLAAGFAFSGLGAGAGASVPQLYSQFALPGDAAPRKAAPVILDAPLTFAADSAGRMHLGVSLPAVGLIASGCSTDAAGNLMCPKLSFAPPPMPTPTVNVTSEVPQPGAVPGTWVLAHAPADPAHSFCLVNGNVQQFGVGYTLAGAVITAAWDAGATIACSYSYLP